MRGAMNRAITSAPPPGPAGMTNSTGFWGSQAATLPDHTSSIASTPSIDAVQLHCFIWCSSCPTSSAELHAVFQGSAIFCAEAVVKVSRPQMCWQGFLQQLLIHRENADTKHLDASLSMIDLSVTEPTILRVFTPASRRALPTAVGSRTITAAR